MCCRGHSAGSSRYHKTFVTLLRTHARGTFVPNLNVTLTSCIWMMSGTRMLVITRNARAFMSCTSGAYDGQAGGKRTKRDQHSKINKNKSITTDRTIIRASSSSTRFVRQVDNLEKILMLRCVQADETKSTSPFLKNDATSFCCRLRPAYLIGASKIILKGVDGQQRQLSALRVIICVVHEVDVHHLLHLHRANRHVLHHV